MKFLCALSAAVLLVTGCGGGSPTSPDGVQYPSVAGSYSGTTTVVFPELGQTVVCPTTTAVTQSGSSISMAPLVLGGQCGNQSIPVGGGTIDTTGALQGSTSGTYNEPSCGTYNWTGSGGFFGRELRMSVNATSTTCYNFNLTINLTR
jgi:hypothetical protein